MSKQTHCINHRVCSSKIIFKLLSFQEVKPAWTQSYYRWKIVQIAILLSCTLLQLTPQKSPNRVESLLLFCKLQFSSSYHRKSNRQQLISIMTDADPELDPKPKPAPRSSFSMAHALSMIRKRESKPQEPNLDEEAKEKSRAKRKRRRQNQKLAKEAKKAKGDKPPLVNQKPETIPETIEVNPTPRDSQVGFKKPNSLVPRALMLKRKMTEWSLINNLESWYNQYTCAC